MSVIATEDMSLQRTSTADPAARHGRTARSWGAPRCASDKNARAVIQAWGAQRGPSSHVSHSARGGVPLTCSARRARALSGMLARARRVSRFCRWLSLASGVARGCTTFWMARARGARSARDCPISAPRGTFAALLLVVFPDESGGREGENGAAGRETRGRHGERSSGRGERCRRLCGTDIEGCGPVATRAPNKRG